MLTGIRFRTNHSGPGQDDPLDKIIRNPSLRRRPTPPTVPSGGAKYTLGQEGDEAASEKLEDIFYVDDKKKSKRRKNR